jgi:hypothetical protein
MTFKRKTHHDTTPANPMMESLARIDELTAAIAENEDALKAATARALETRDGFKAPTTMAEAEARSRDRPDSQFGERQKAFVAWCKSVQAPMQATVYALRKSLTAEKQNFANLRAEFESENLSEVTAQAADRLSVCRTNEGALKAKLDALQSDTSNWRAAATGFQAEMAALEAKQAQALISGGDFDEAEFARLAAEVLATQRKVKAAETAHGEVKRQHQQARESTRTAEIELSRLQRVGTMNSARELIEPLFNGTVPLWAIRDALAADHRFGLTVRP